MCTTWKTASCRRISRLLAICLCVGLTGCTLLPSETQREPLPDIRPLKMAQKPTYTVKKGSIELTATASGKIVSEKEETLSFREGNRQVTDVLVKRGDQVKEGQLLAELENADLKVELLRKEIEYIDAWEKWKELAVASDDAETPEFRKQTLYLKLLQEERNFLEQRLRNTRLLAPFSGTVFSLDISEGDIIERNKPIATMADLSELVAMAEFSTSDVRQLAVGTDCRVQVNGLGEIAGKIIQLPDILETSEEKRDDKDNMVWIRLDTVPEGMKNGMLLTARVPVQRKENTLLLPSAALRTQNNRQFVIVEQPDGTQGEVNVETGLSTATEVEIVKGLSEGQKVVGK